MRRLPEGFRGLGLKLVVALLWLLVVAPATAAAKDKAWLPERTWVFVVGILEWQDTETFESFPKENRRDLELISFFRERGVPSTQIVYLQDRAATARRIQNALVSLLSKTREGDTLFLYYTGHGYRAENGRAYFASYDASDDNPGWSMDSIPTTVERYFKGDKAFLTADCCFSGALADAVRSRPRRTSYAVFASATSDKTSTGEWTFTECLLAALRGLPYVDTDGNGEVTLSELGREIKGDMAFAEQQTSFFILTGALDAQTVLAGAEPRSDKSVGARVEVYSEGDWYKARIIDAGRGKYRVRYYGYDDSYNEWVKPAQIRGRDTRAKQNPTPRSGNPDRAEALGASPLR